MKSRSSVGEVGLEVPKVAGVLRAVRRVGRGELLLEGAGDLRQLGRVEPEVRVVTGQVGGLRGVHDVGRVALVDGVVHGGLEPPLVEQHVGVRDRGGLPELQLEVVRLLAGLGQVRDVRPVARHPLRDVLQGVEGRHDGGPLAGIGVGAPARGQQRRDEGERPGEQQGAGDGPALHENDSQY